MPSTGDPLTTSLNTDLTADLDEKEDLAKAACQFISFPVTAGTETSPTVPAPTGPAVVTIWERYLLGRERLCDTGKKFILIPSMYSLYTL